MKVLVTGSQGYIGTILADQLLQKGYEVVGLDTGFFKDAQLYPHELKSPSKMIVKDIRQVSVNDVKGFDFVIHLAELSNDPLGHINPELTHDVNHLGTKRLVEACIEAGVPRFVYSSSCSVYGASDELITEASQTHPLTPYAKSKVLNEQMLLEKSSDTFVPVILRNATVFGASPRLRFDLAVNNLVGVAWTTGSIQMDGDGTAWRPFVHVLDVAGAFIAALEAPADVVRNHIFNVGSSQANYQIKTVAETIQRHMPHTQLQFGTQGGDARNYKVNFDKIATQLPNFAADKTLEDGIDELMAIFKTIDLTQEMFSSKDFTRLKQIEYLKETSQVNQQLFWQNS